MERSPSECCTWDGCTPGCFTFGRLGGQLHKLAALYSFALIVRRSRADHLAGDDLTRHLCGGGLESAALYLTLLGDVSIYGLGLGVFNLDPLFVVYGIPLTPKSLDPGTSRLCRSGWALELGMARSSSRGCSEHWIAWAGGPPSGLLFIRADGLPSNRAATGFVIPETRRRVRQARET